MDIIAQDPLYFSPRSLNMVLPDLTTYSHQIDADGGFKNATIQLALDIGAIDDWIKNGLGRHIISRSDDGIVIWEGFVNLLTINFGIFSFSRGPLLDITNRVQLKYNDFTVGQPAITTAQNDTSSQDLYGIIHRVISTGTVSSTTAENIRNTYLQENKLPQSTPTLSLQGTDLSITLECQGYTEWLNAYPYNESTDTTYTAREKVLEVLGDDPNGIFSTNYNQIEANSLSVNRLEEDYRVALSVIQDIVLLGGASNNNRRLFGIYEDQICYLQEIPSTVEYFVRITDPAVQITTAAEQVVDPATLRPGKWLKVVDFLPGETSPTNLREDPRMIFIESVTYTAPTDFSVNGGKTNTLTQQLNKLGLGSIG